MSILNFMRDAVHYDRIADVLVEAPMADLRRNTKVVVIDDDPDSFPTRALQDDGYTIEPWTSVDSGRLTRLESADFAVVILDIKGVTRPGLSDTGDSLGILRRIKQVNPRQIVVAFSGQQYDLDAVPFWKLADDSLTKPVSIVQCKQLLDALIEDRLTAAAQWRSVEHTLRLAGKSGWAIRRTEGALVRSIKNRHEPDRLTLAGILGTIDSFEAIVTWARRIFFLCSLI